YAISYSLFALLQCHVHNVGERGVPVVHVDIKALLTEGPHRIKPLFFPRPTATDPDFYAVQLPLRLGFAHAGNDPPKRFLYILEVGNGATDDNVLDAGQRTDLVGEHFHGPIGRVARVLGIIGQLSASRYHGVRIIDACPAPGLEHRGLTPRDLDELD